MDVNHTCKIAVLISGGGSNLQSIIDHIQQGNIHAEIACVISNQSDAYGLSRATQANIPTHIIDHKNHNSREEFDLELINTLAVYSIQLIVLAGFMRILSTTFIDEYEGKILNIHPSLLPKYPGLHTHTRSLQARDKEHGCSVHFVTAELDNGPIVIQAKVPIHDPDTPDNLAERVLDKEHVIYPLAIKWFSEGRLHFSNGNAYLDEHLLAQPLTLTSELEAELQ